MLAKSSLISESVKGPDRPLATGDQIVTAEKLSPAAAVARRFSERLFARLVRKLLHWHRDFLLLDASRRYAARDGA
jgi:hypothetical protein